MFWKKNISEQNDGISSEILPSFRTEAVEDRDVIFNQIQVSYVKFPHLRNVQMLFLWLKSVYLMPNKWFEVWQSMFKHPVGKNENIFLLTDEEATSTIFFFLLTS